MNSWPTLIYLPSDNPFVTMKVYFRTGPRYESLRHRGLSHIIEHIVSDLFEKKLSRATRLPAWIRPFSLDTFSASTHFEFCSYEISIDQKNFWKSASSLISSFAPRKITNSFLSKQKKIVASEAHESMQANGFALAAQKAHFQGSSLERRFISNQDYLKDITANNVFDYWHQTYQARHCTVMISGNLTRNTLLRLKKLLVKSLPSQLEMSLPDDFSIDLKRNILHLSQDSLPGTSIEASFLRPATKPYDILLAQFSMYLLVEYLEYQLREKLGILYSVKTDVISGSDFVYNSFALDSPSSPLETIQKLHKSLKSFPRIITKDVFSKALQNHNLALSRQAGDHNSFLRMLESFIPLSSSSIPSDKSEYLKIARSLKFVDFQIFAKSLSQHLNLSVAGKISKASAETLSRQLGLDII
ncbi:MAG: insulinase family protein [Candidatus Paceibacterota bacterium]